MRGLVFSALLVAACASPAPGTPYPSEAPASGVATSAPPSAAQDPVVARYGEREIDLAPFLKGFPYGQLKPAIRDGQLFYLELGERYTLRRSELPAEYSGPLDMAAGAPISDVDWSARSLWGMTYHRQSKMLWLHADERNDERMNLWTLDPANGALTQVTDHDYTYGYGFSEDQERIAYISRKGTKAPYESCLWVRNVQSGAARKVACDNPKLSYTWSDLVFTPDGNEVIFNAQIGGDRNRVQLVSVDLRKDKPKPRLITDARVSRNTPTALAPVGAELLFLANDDGYSNLYSHSLATGRVRQLTKFREDLTHAEITDAGVFGVHQSPAGSTLVLIDPQDGKVIRRASVPGKVDVLGAHGKIAIYAQQSPGILFEGYRVELSGESLLGQPLILPDPELAAKAMHCKATAVKIPTFDDAPDGKGKRLLHAFLLEPKEPQQDPKQRLAMITAFYGGANRYRAFDQIMCAAGFTVVSPAVRGSRGFGKAFFGLNDKDLGGDEIVDLFYVARWLAQRTGLPARRIGVYGGSHGGYATMRALTFPPETNKRNEFYPFGFGLAHAGFSDIKTFHDASNIPDWVVLESGDPAIPEELARMKDRSPLTHVERLRVPLLLTHGSNDWRVPVSESRQFATKAKALGRPVVYVEFEGQGHHIKGVELQAKAYQARFDFLEAIARQAPETATAK